MPSQEPVTSGQIKPESSRETETSSPKLQRNVSLQPPRRGANRYSINDAYLVVDMVAASTWPAAGMWEDMPASYHNGACGFAFCDGHAEIHKWIDSQTKAPVIQNYTPQWQVPDGVSTGYHTTSSRDNAWIQARTTAPK